MHSTIWFTLSNAIFTVVQEKSERDDLGADDQQLALKVLHELKLVPLNMLRLGHSTSNVPRISQVHLHTLDSALSYYLAWAMHRFIRRHFTTSQPASFSFSSIYNYH